LLLFVFIELERNFLQTDMDEFSVVPSGLGSVSYRLTQDLRPGLNYAAAPRLESANAPATESPSSSFSSERDKRHD